MPTFPALHPPYNGWAQAVPIQGMENQPYLIQVCALGAKVKTIYSAFKRQMTPNVKTKLPPDSYGVQDWKQPGKTVIESSDIHAAAAAIADSRTPEEHERWVWIILAPDGT